MKMHSLKMMAIGIAACTVAAQAQVSLKGFGWDGASVNNSPNPAAGEVTARIGLGGFNNLEAGFGFSYAESPTNAPTEVEDANSLISFSARYLLALHEWDKFTGFLVLGGHFQDDFYAPPGLAVTPHPTASSFSLIAAYQPELVLVQHFSVSTRFGLQYTISPITVVGLVGAPVSIIGGFDFHILL